MKEKLTQFKTRIYYVFPLLFLLTGLVENRAHGQPVNTYVFSASSGTFTPLVGATATSIAATADGAISTAFPIGFTFNFDGNNYTQVMASSDGVLLFGTGRTQTLTNNLATTTATQRPGIAPLWDDLQCRQGVTYQLSGTAPNRVLTVEWLNMEWNYNANAATISFQVKLYETTNVAEMIYRQETAGVTNGSASIGIMGVTSNNYISLTNSTATPGTSTTTSTNNISAKPATDQVYTFTPPPCSGAPSPGVAALTNIPGCGTGGYIIAVTGSSLGSGISYQWQSSPDQSSWTNMLNDTLESLSKTTVTALTYFRRLTTCNNSALTSQSNSVAVKPVYAGITAVNSSFCYDSTTLSLTSASDGSVTYNWLSSIDSVNWSLMGITTATAKFPSPTATRYYRCIVTCGTELDTSIAVRVNEPCQNFGTYGITRNTNVTYNSIQATGSSFVWAGTSADDDRTLPILFPSGFNFTFAGSIRPAFYISTNGWLSLDTTVFSTSLANNMNSTSPRLVLAPFWDDLLVLGGTTANRSLIKYEVIGAAPNRIVIVEWSEMERFGYASPSLNFQIKMYEGSNNIEFVYGKMQPFDGSGNGSFTYSTGLLGAVPNNGQRLALLLENTNNFSTGILNDNLSIAPLCNSSYLFTYGAVFNPTNVSAVPNNDSSSFPITLNVNALPCADICGTIYSTRGATSSGTSLNPISGNPDDDVWFSFVAPASGQVNISVTGSPSFDPAFMVMNTLFDTTGIGQASSRNAATTAIESAQATSLIPNNTYLIRVFNAGAGSGSTSGSFSICVNEVIPAPANDDTSGAVLLNATQACNAIAGTTLGATASTQTVCGGLADDDVWYRFTPSAAVDTVTVTGTGTFRPHVQVLTRMLGSLSCVSNNMNAGTVKITLNNLIKDSVYYIRIYNTNAGAASGGFTVCVNGNQATSPVIATGSSNSVLVSSATISGSIINNGGYPITQSGVVFSTSPSPAKGGLGVIDSINNPLVITGNFTKNIAGLSPSTTYYYRAYAVNAMGVGYGADSTFTTPASAFVPTVLRVAASNLQATTTTVGGNITSDGGAPVTTSGIVYSTSPNPVLLGLGVVDSATSPVVASGVFTINPAGLIQSTKYYYRAYATNSAGTSYSVEDSFTTLPIINSFPYSQNFDLPGNTGWTSAIVGGTVNNWVVGAPTKTFINGAYSAPNAWVTNLTGNYSNSHNAAVVSPQMDLTSLTNDPILRFKHKFVTEAGWDALIIEISINGGAWTKLDNTLGTGSNYNTTNSIGWYNSSSGSGPIGAPKFSSLTSGTGSNSIHSSQVNGWLTSSTPLIGAAGQANVKVRFRFGSDGGTNYEGWALDDIEVFTATTPTLVTGTKTNITTSNATVVGNIVNTGGIPVTASGVVISTSPNPTRGTVGVIDSTTNPLVSTGTFSVNLTGLTSATTYYYRAYAVNAQGTSYGADSTFTTNASAVLPTVTKVTASNITTTTVTVGGNIVSDGGSPITVSGVVYSILPNPQLLVTGVVDSTTTPLVANGSFSINPIGLMHSTKYYYRAYATNSVGTAYSVEDSFTTAPIISTLPYNQNFDLSSNTGWTSTAVAGTINNWVLGTPAKTVLNGAFSAPNAWVTKLTGNYDDSHNAAVVSPQFNLTAVNADPVLRFKHKFICESGYDALVVEISINGGTWTKLDNVTGTGTNFNSPQSYAWYNNTSINGPITPSKFSGDPGSVNYATQASGWIESATRLTGAAGQSNVKVRFRFGTDGSGVREGWAIDDIELVEVITPTTAVSNVSVTSNDTSANVTFIAGNGQGRMVVARLSSTLAVAPTNNTLYNASSVYGSTNTTGTGNFIVYMGNGTSVSVTGLTALTGYTFDVYEYNGKYMHNSFAGAISSNTTTTPVKLVSLKATRVNEDVLVSWTTASELNNRGFNVERSVDGNTFELVGFVKGSGNSSVANNYRLEDANAFAKAQVNKLYYRLKQMDKDGKFVYSNVVTVTNTDVVKNTISAYPNPFNTDVTVSLNATKASTANITVFDFSGRNILSNNYQVAEGSNIISINEMSNLNTGIYFVKIAVDGQEVVIKMIKN